METRAQLNRVRLAPRKVRAVARLMAKKNVQSAIDQLEHVVRRPAPILLKLLKSAVANAENNFRMVSENLYVKRVAVDEGTKLKRFMPRARGRSAEIQKKTSRIEIVLDERTPGLKKQVTRSVAERERPSVEAIEERRRRNTEHSSANVGSTETRRSNVRSGEEADKESTVRSQEEYAGRRASPPTGKPEVKREMGKKSGMFGNLRKRLFQRKSV